MNEQGTKSDSQSMKGGRGLAVTMSILMLLIALIPLVVIATTVVVSLSNSIQDLGDGLLSTRDEMAQSVVGANLANEADITMNAIDVYMRERVQDAIEWANAPIVRQAAQEGAVQAEELGLTELSIDQIEQRMDSTRALSQDPELVAYLTDLSRRTPAFIEMFFTEEHGFNVAYNNKTSDFVQIGEEWWDTAWSQGTYISPVEYDDSAGIFSIEISVRIEDAGGKPLGVLKAVLDIDALHEADGHPVEVDLGTGLQAGHVAKRGVIAGVTGEELLAVADRQYRQRQSAEGCRGQQPHPEVAPRLVTHRRLPLWLPPQRTA